ncbi:unnamed protein product [Ectocarpus sp. 12 AP-2014]
MLQSCDLLQSSRQPRNDEGLPVFRTALNRSIGERRSSGQRVAPENVSEFGQKRLQRKPPVPKAAEAASQVKAGAQSSRDKSRRKERVSPSRSAGGVKSPHSRDRDRDRDRYIAERAAKGHCVSDDREAGVAGTRRGASRGSDWKHLLMMLRQAVGEMDDLRRDVASANQERAAWKQRDEDLSLTISRLEGRCEALERSVRAESEAAKAEVGRTKVAEARFARLLAWAREEEEDRRRAEEALGRACESGRALEARGKALEEEAHESKRQLDERRLKMEGALEDLRRRTAENERLEAQAKTVGGQVDALRELADARGLEVKEMREKLARLVKEAKRMSQENVDLRKHMNSEQERWRAAERSRAKQDERRRIELDQKCDDLHALRYRVQELEARLSRETTRRHGAEEDARRSQEMERRSMDELLEGRKAALSVQTRIGRAQNHPYHYAPADGGQAPAPEHAWKPWGSRGNAAGGTATTAAMTSGARSSTISDAFHPGGRARHEDSEDQPGDHYRWQDHATSRGRDRNGLSPSAAILPPPPLRPPPLVSVAALRASLRGPGGQRSPSPAVGSTGVGLKPSVQPQTHTRSPKGLDNSRAGARPRPQPRRAPSEDDCDRGAGNGEAANKLSTGDGVGEGVECGSDEEGGEWWAGGGEMQDLNGKPSGLQDTPLHVVSL